MALSRRALRAFAAAARLRAAAARAHSTVGDRYSALISDGGLLRDPAQEAAVGELDGLLRRVTRYATARTAVEAARSLLGEPALPPGYPAPLRRPLMSELTRLPRGLYVWGGVGTGKSMLMDLAYEAVRDLALAPPPLEAVAAQVGVQRAWRARGVDQLAAAVAQERARAAADAGNPPPPPLPLVQPTDALTGLPDPAAWPPVAPPLPARLPARRVHFHAFMLDVHARIHEWKQRALATHGRSVHIDKRPERDAIVQVARAIAAEAWLLCFDEFQVTDVADALIMSRLFGTLFAEGCVLVATSNRPPGELYKDGLNRAYFLPFLESLGAHAKVTRLDAAHDYRFHGAVAATAAAAAQAAVEGGGPPAAAAAPVGSALLHPLGPAADAALLAAVRSIVREPPPAAAAAAAAAAGGGDDDAAAQPIARVGDLDALPLASVGVLMGRSLAVRSPAPGVAVASFDELCARPLGAADYQALCGAFHTLVLTGVPLQVRSRHNEARRFVTLVDELYEHRTRLVATADAGPEGLFAPLLSGTGDEDVASLSMPALAAASADTRLETPPPPSSSLPAHVVAAVRAQVGGSNAAVAGAAAHAAAAAAAAGAGAGAAPSTAAGSVTASTAAGAAAGAGAPTDVDPASSAGVVAAAEEAALGELAFATRRAISRLTEMASPRYGSSAATAAVRRRLASAAAAAIATPEGW